MVTNLSDINKFIALQSDDDLTNVVNNKSLSATLENVSIASDTRLYEKEIHFTNPDNTYIGKYYIIDDNNNSILVNDAVTSVIGVNDRINDIEDGYKQSDEYTYQRAKSYTNTEIAKIRQSLTDYINAYINNSISALNVDTDARITTVSLSLSEHVIDNTVHVNDNERIGIAGGLNAQYISSTSKTDLINGIKGEILSEVSVIDGGIINRR